jgi:hypothetical protein
MATEKHCNLDYFLSVNNPEHFLRIISEIFPVGEGIWFLHMAIVDKSKTHLLQHHEKHLPGSEQHPWPPVGSRMFP